jgi:hypothetical protein
VTWSDVKKADFSIECWAIGFSFYRAKVHILILPMGSSFPTEGS